MRNFQHFPRSQHEVGKGTVFQCPQGRYAAVPGGAAGEINKAMCQSNPAPGLSGDAAAGFVCKTNRARLAASWNRDSTAAEKEPMNIDRALSDVHDDLHWAGFLTDPLYDVYTYLVYHRDGSVIPRESSIPGTLILAATDVTHAGTFGPGTFVWFPEGEVMEHGAGTEGDVAVLFVTNKAFRIDYVDEKPS